MAVQFTMLTLLAAFGPVVTEESYQANCPVTEITFRELTDPYSCFIIFRTSGVLDPSIAGHHAESTASL